MTNWVPVWVVWWWGPEQGWAVGRSGPVVRSVMSSPAWPSPACLYKVSIIMYRITNHNTPLPPRPHQTVNTTGIFSIGKRIAVTTLCSGVWSLHQTECRPPSKYVQLPTRSRPVDKRKNRIRYVTLYSIWGSDSISSQCFNTIFWVFS